jgi:hypothetical protein
MLYLKNAGFEKVHFSYCDHLLFGQCLHNTLFYSEDSLARLSIPIFTECGQNQNQLDPNFKKRATNNPGNILTKYIYQIIHF